MQVAGPVHLLGLFAHEAGRSAEAEQYFRRVLKITESRLGPEDPQVSSYCARGVLTGLKTMACSCIYSCTTSGKRLG